MAQYTSILSYTLIMEDYVGIHIAWLTMSSYVAWSKKIHCRWKLQCATLVKLESSTTHHGMTILLLVVARYPSLSNESWQECEFKESTLTT